MRCTRNGTRNESKTDIYYMIFIKPGARILADAVPRTKASQWQQLIKEVAPVQPSDYLHKNII